MRRIFLLVLVVVACVQVAGRAHAVEDASNVDVVMVLDHSGSMKQNDPQNMRISAARLFTQLAVNGDQLGVVGMGDKASTRALLSLSAVDAGGTFAWNSLQALEAPPELAQWTYMGEALDVAAGVMENAPKHNPQRAVIFLTDGKPTYTDADQADQERKFDAAVARLSAQHVKAFPIALGADADPGYLESRLATTTGGKLYVAPTPDQLTNIFVDILAQLQDGRYVDQYSLVANTETFLANVSPRQQVEQINFVLPTQGQTPPTVKQVLLPDTLGGGGLDKMSHAEDPNWALLTARPEYVPRINGEWRIDVDAPTAQVPVIAVIKSNLRARLADPQPSKDDDNGSVRYHPAGKPLLVRAGALNAGDRLEKRLGVNVQITPGPAWTLDDNGRGGDTAPDDGLYTGISAEPLAPGTYHVAVNLSPTDTHLLLAKTYDLVVEPLPTMQAAIVPNRPLQPGEPVRVEVRWALDGQPATLDAAELTAAVKRDDQVIGTLPLVREKDRWVGSYVPDMPGPVSFAITAHATWNAPDRGLRRYTDYVEAAYDVARQPLVDVRVDNTGERVNDLQNGIQRTVQFTSQSDEPVTLHLGVKGVPDAAVYPDTLTIAPQEQGSHTVTIRSTQALHSGAWNAYLTVDGDSHVRLSATDVPVSFTVNPVWWRYRVPIVLLSGVVGVLARRKTRRSLADAVTRNVELLRYGGR